jgi:hypothetical protein
MLKLALAGGCSLSLMWIGDPSARAMASTHRLTVATALDDTPAPARYRFNCITPIPAFSPLGRLDEVWASSRYMTFTGCVVTYVGAGEMSLTPEESAIVDVVAAAGGDVSDREVTFLRVLTASTRVDPARLAEKLAEFGRPIVEGSLALAPDAPQAKLFADWLAASA